MSGQSSSLTRWSVSPGETTLRRGGAQHAPRGRHHHRGRDALVGDVADDDADLAVGQLEEVVEVAADLAGRLVVRVELPAGELGQHAREEVLLDQLRDAELLLDALARRGLGRLPPDELGHLQRRRGLRGERVEQPLVVGRVLLVGEPRAEVERADQLAARDERHDERDAGRPERVDGRRLELEPLDLDRAAGGLEVRDQRVVGRDLDRRPGRQALPATAASGLAAGRRAASAAGASPPLRITLRIVCEIVDISPSFVREQRHGIVTDSSLRSQIETCAGCIVSCDDALRGRRAAPSSSTCSRSRAPNASSVRCGVVAAPVEAAVDEPLHARAQRQEQRRDDERRDRDREVRAAGERREHRLPGEHERRRRRRRAAP